MKRNQVREQKLALTRGARKNCSVRRERSSQNYSPTAFQQASGLAARTVHDWVRRKLIPKPIGRGRAAIYGAGHLTAARVVRHLREKNESLAQIRARIHGLTEAQLLALLPVPPPPAATAETVQQAPNATYPAKTVEAVELMEGLVLLVEPERGGLVRRVAADIYQTYGVRR